MNYFFIILTSLALAAGCATLSPPAAKATSHIYKDILDSGAELSKSQQRLVVEDLEKQEKINEAKNTRIVTLEDRLADLQKKDQFSWPRQLWLWAPGWMKTLLVVFASTLLLIAGLFLLPFLPKILPAISAAKKAASIAGRALRSGAGLLGKRLFSRWRRK